MIAPLIGGLLVSEIREKPAPLPGESHMRRVLVHQVTHVGLILRAIAGAKLGHVGYIDAVGQIDLPFRIDVELRLRPTPSRFDPVLADSANRQDGLSGIDAEDPQRSAFKDLARKIELLTER